MNAFNRKKNRVLNVVNGKHGAVPTVAREYKASGIPWIVIGDTNFGEGSSREHAALEVRHLGGVAVIAKSFARIYETNLKRQGLLPLTFRNQNDYDNLEEHDKIYLDLSGLRLGGSVVMIAKKKSGGVVKIELVHTLTEVQLEWFRCGSALNAMREAKKRQASS